MLTFSSALIQTFFLVPAEFPLISMCDNTVRMDSISMDFHWTQQTNWDHDQGWCAYVIVTDILLIAE